MKRLILISFLSPLFVSCASIISNSKYPVVIDSAPSGVDFVIRDEDGEKVHAGKTPATIDLSSSAGFFDAAQYTVAFERADGADHEVELAATLDPWYWGNFLFGGLIGFLIVDPATGSMWRFSEDVMAEL